MVKLKKISLEEDFLSEMEMLQVYGGNMANGDVNMFCGGSNCVSGCGGSGSDDDDPSSNDKKCSCKGKGTCCSGTCNC